MQVGINNDFTKLDLNTFVEETIDLRLAIDFLPLVKANRKMLI